MTIYSVKQVKEMIDAYFEAEKEVLKGKSITFDGKTWTRESLSELNKSREKWERLYRQLTTPSRCRSPAIASF